MVWIPVKAGRGPGSTLLKLLEGGFEEVAFPARQRGGRAWGGSTVWAKAPSSERVQVDGCGEDGDRLQMGQLWVQLAFGLCSEGHGKMSKAFAECTMHGGTVV